MKDIIIENPYKFLEGFLKAIPEIDYFKYDEIDAYDIYLKEPIKYYELGKRFKDYITTYKTKQWIVSDEAEYPDTYTVHYDKKNDDWTYILFHFIENKPNSDISIIITEII